MYKSQSIPTIFATSIAEQVGLVPKNIHGHLDDEGFTIQNPEMRLTAFQQMSIACPIEECLLAYHGVELSEEQHTALKLIHKSTTPWLIGHVIAELVDGKDKTIKNAEFILTQLIKDGKVDQKEAKRLLVSLQVVDPDKKGDSNQ